MRSNLAPVGELEPEYDVLYCGVYSNIGLGAYQTCSGPSFKTLSPEFVREVLESRPGLERHSGKKYNVYPCLARSDSLTKYEGPEIA